MSTPPTSTPWVPTYARTPFRSAISPPQNGKWAQGLNGAVTWIDFSLPGLVTPDTNWHVVGDVGEPQLQNGWLNYGGVYGPARFRKLADGLVLLEGLIYGGPSGVGAFILPVGYRPTLQQDGSIPVHHFYSSASPALPWGSVHINQNWEVCPTIGGGDWTSLNEIRFYAG